MTSLWMDAHCHLSDAAFDATRPDLYDELIRASVHGLVLAGTDPDDWQRQIALSPPPPLRIARVFGVHPWFVDSMSDPELESAMAALQGNLPNAVGLGELGFDFFRARREPERLRQRYWFLRQLALRPDDLPLVLHVVRAHHECLPLLRKHRKKGIRYRGLVHSFWANAEVARAYIELGFHLSLPPRIMKEDPHGLLRTIAPEHLVFETDTPYVDAAGAFVGPTMIREFLAFISAARAEPLHETALRQNEILVGLFPVLKGE